MAVKLPAPMLIPMDKSLLEVEEKDEVLLTEEILLRNPAVEAIVVVARITIVELPSPILNPTDRTVPDGGILTSPT